MVNIYKGIDKVVSVKGLTAGQYYAMLRSKSSGEYIASELITVASSATSETITDFLFKYSETNNLDSGKVDLQIIAKDRSKISIVENFGTVVETSLTDTLDLSVNEEKNDK